MTRLFASDWIAFHADRTPDMLAQIDQASGRRFTYDGMNTRAERLAAFLRREWGLKKGDRLALLARNSTEYFEVQWACMKLGALLLPLNWRLAEPELRFILSDAAPVGLIHDVEFAERAAPLLADRPRLAIHWGQPAPDGGGYEEAIAAASDRIGMSPRLTHDDPMMILYTAGTTGHPKGVLITYGMMTWNAVNITTPTGLSLDSVFYGLLPTFHIGGLNLYANPVLHLGGTNIIARQFEPGLTLQTLSDPAIGVTHLFGVPSIYQFMSQHPDFEAADLSRVQSWGCGGAPMPTAILDLYARRGIVVQLGFGMTETSPTVFLTDKRRALAKPTSVGKPLQHTRVRVVRPDLTDTAPGEVGEVLIAGPNVTPGYWQRAQANAESFVIDPDGLRWLRSGDAGLIDEEGCVYVVDRYKDMYISGGENVYPAEVEQVLYQIDGVAEAAVIGLPDAKWGECGLAIVVPRPGVPPDPVEILAFCAGRLAKFKVPKTVAFIDALPRNAAGKVLKRELRARFMPTQESTP